MGYQLHVILIYVCVLSTTTTGFDLPNCQPIVGVLPKPGIYSLSQTTDTRFWKNNADVEDRFCTQKKCIQMLLSSIVIRGNPCVKPVKMSCMDTQGGIYVYVRKSQILTKELTSLKTLGLTKHTTQGSMGQKFRRLPCLGTQELTGLKTQGFTKQTSQGAIGQKIGGLTCLERQELTSLQPLGLPNHKTQGSIVQTIEGLTCLGAQGFTSQKKQGFTCFMETHGVYSVERWSISRTETHREGQVTVVNCDKLQAILKKYPKPSLKDTTYLQLISTILFLLTIILIPQNVFDFKIYNRDSTREERKHSECTKGQSTYDSLFSFRSSVPQRITVAMLPASQRHNGHSHFGPIIKSKGDNKIPDYRKARNRDFTEKNARYESFYNWSRYNAPDPETLAEAGFYAIGYRDTVRCFYCAGGLSGLEPDTDPLELHMQLYPSCEYIRYIVETGQAGATGRGRTADHPSRTKGQQASYKHNQRSPQVPTTTPNSNNRGGTLTHEDIKQLLLMGVSRQTIEDLVCREISKDQDNADLEEVSPLSCLLSNEPGNIAVKSERGEKNTQQATNSTGEHQPQTVPGAEGAQATKSTGEHQPQTVSRAEGAQATKSTGEHQPKTVSGAEGIQATKSTGKHQPQTVSRTESAQSTKSTGEHQLQTVSGTEGAQSTKSTGEHQLQTVSGTEGAQATKSTGEHQPQTVCRTEGAQATKSTGKHQTQTVCRTEGAQSTKSTGEHQLQTVCRTEGAQSTKSTGEHQPQTVCRTEGAQATKSTGKHQPQTVCRTEGAQATKSTGEHQPQTVCRTEGAHSTKSTGEHQPQTVTEAESAHGSDEVTQELANGQPQSEKQDKESCRRTKRVDVGQKKLKSENNQLKDQMLCKICLDRNSSVVFLNCGHMVACAVCSNNVRKCPICRKFIKGRIKVAGKS